MNKKLFIVKEIITADSSNSIFRDHALEITDDRITGILPLGGINFEDYGNNVLRFPSLSLIPGFVQTHIHLCQTLFRGLADDLELLDWLKFRIFPYENCHNPQSLSLSARIGIHELLTSGTTTILDMGTLRHQEVIFEELIASGIRAIAGQCMIDENDLLDSFKLSYMENISRSYEMASAFHNAAKGRVKYGFAPRFVLSCSEKLLKETYHMLEDFEGSLFHTHSSENRGEVEEVRRKTGMENIEYFNHIGILGNSTVLAHCIHLNENEIKLLRDTSTRVAHCPSSNLKLGSGIAGIPRMLKENICVSIGADGAPCNNNLNMFNEMRLSALIQKPFHGPTAMDALTVFRLATIEGARALKLDNEVGSIETGKKADFVLLDLEMPQQTLLEDKGNVYSNIVYSAGRDNVKQVYVDGQCLVENGIQKNIDVKELFHTGKSALEFLLKTV